MASHLNVFERYDNHAITHENSLTRAFLVVLRCVPVAHAAWLALVDEAHRLNEGSGLPGLHVLPRAHFETQVGELPESVARVVSVLQTDEHYFAASNVGASNRKQILDGVVSYKPHLAIAIENKLLAANVWEGQLSVNLGPSSQGEQIEHDARVACVTWRSIIMAWEQLLQSDCISGGERCLVEDFLEYVETHFDRLQPYSTIGACGESRYRLKRRCRKILEELVECPRSFWT